MSSHTSRTIDSRVLRSRPLQSTPSLLPSEKVTPQAILKRLYDDMPASISTGKDYMTIPRRRQPTDDLFRPIEFDNPAERCSVNLREIRRGTATVKYPHDRVFLQPAWRYISWAIDWPGYEVTYIPQLLDVAPRWAPSITRLQLAQHISNEVYDFMKRVCAGVEGYQHKPETPEDSKWAIGAGKITFDDVRLHTLQYCDGFFVPTLYIVT